MRNDPAAWAQAMAAGPSRLVDALIVFVGEIRFDPEFGAPVTPVTADVEWHSPADRGFWHTRYVAERGSESSPTFQRLASLSGSLITRSREQLVGDGEWYRSIELNEKRRPLEIDDMPASFRRPPDVSPGFRRRPSNRVESRRRP